MAENFLKGFPPPAGLSETVNPGSGTISFTTNGHIHTPYSFSAFEDLYPVFIKAKEEKIDVLGINDFYVTDGYKPFHDGCVAAKIFPLFNIEFIGLMKKKQEEGMRINDPNNPGRIYFCGKGLDYPFHLSFEHQRQLSEIKLETQIQLTAMIRKVNELISSTGSRLRLDFESIKKRFARDLVRERHIAKAIRMLAVENFCQDSERILFIESLYNGKKSTCSFADSAALENEIRSNLLKAGGAAFVEENDKSFLPVEAIMEIINDAGGIPCYPVLLDDLTGNITEYERDREVLLSSLSGMGVNCIELIPGRNSQTILEEFVEFFDSNDFIITFGTEHNTPEMVPLKVSARGGVPLGENLEQIGRKGVCIIAGHQYLKARNEEGYIDSAGKPRKAERKEFESLGQSVIEYFLRRN